MYLNISLSKFVWAEWNEVVSHIWFDTCALIGLKNIVFDWWSSISRNVLEMCFYDVGWSEVLNFVQSTLWEKLNDYRNK